MISEAKNLTNYLKEVPEKNPDIKPYFMIQIVCKLMMTVMLLVSSIFHLSAQQMTNTLRILGQKYNLVPPHSKDTQYYEMESKLQKHALDGTIQGTDVYRLYLRCVPSPSLGEKDEYTCLKFTVQINNFASVTIPSLTSFKYFFSLRADPGDKKGQMFGIDQSKFEKLVDNNGKDLPLENTFHVYNAFIDFHTMSVFAEKTAKDSGVQDLTHIGEKIIHEASFSQPHVNLGALVPEGSYFKNGKITLDFKGLGLVNRKNCAILDTIQEKVHSIW